VADFDAWRPEESTAARPRGPFLPIETFESREIVDALLNDPAIQQEMIDHGVDVSSVAVDLLDEVGSMVRLGVSSVTFRRHRRSDPAR
jgi:hypothetical protein